MKKVFSLTLLVISIYLLVGITLLILFPGLFRKQIPSQSFGLVNVVDSGTSNPKLDLRSKSSFILFWPAFLSFRFN